jgi:hypothetical protein
MCQWRHQTSTLTPSLEQQKQRVCTKQPSSAGLTRKLFRIFFDYLRWLAHALQSIFLYVESEIFCDAGVLGCLQANNLELLAIGDAVHL